MIFFFDWQITPDSMRIIINNFISLLIFCGLLMIYGHFADDRIKIKMYKFGYIKNSLENLCKKMPVNWGRKHFLSKFLFRVSRFHGAKYTKNMYNLIYKFVLFNFSIILLYNFYIDENDAKNESFCNIFACVPPTNYACVNVASAKEIFNRLFSNSNCLILSSSLRIFIRMTVFNNSVCPYFFIHIETVDIFLMS